METCDCNLCEKSDDEQRFYISLPVSLEAAAGRKPTLPLSAGIQNLLQKSEPSPGASSRSSADTLPDKKSSKVTSDAEDKKRHSQSTSSSNQNSAKPSPSSSTHEVAALNITEENDLSQPQSMPAELFTSNNRPDWGFTRNLQSGFSNGLMSSRSLTRDGAVQRRHSPSKRGLDTDWDFDLPQQAAPSTMPYIPPPDYTPPSRRASSQRLQPNSKHVSRLEPCGTTANSLILSCKVPLSTLHDTAITS